MCSIKGKFVSKGTRQQRGLFGKRLRVSVIAVVVLSGLIYWSSAQTAVQSNGVWFDPFLYVYTLADGQLSPDSNWNCAWTGYGSVNTESQPTVAEPGNLAIKLKPAVTTASSITHSSLVTTSTSFANATVDFDVRTLQQLRLQKRGKKNYYPAPNTWEVAWVMFRMVNTSNMYYFVVKTNGAEMGKLVNGSQYFLATTAWPTLTLNTWNHWTLRLEGNHLIASVDGQKVIDYYDIGSPYLSGAVGLYCEDAEVQFDNVQVTPLP